MTRARMFGWALTATAMIASGAAFAQDPIPVVGVFAYVHDLTGELRFEGPLLATATLMPFPTVPGRRYLWRYSMCDHPGQAGSQIFEAVPYWVESREREYETVVTTPPISGLASTFFWYVEGEVEIGSPSYNPGTFYHRSLQYVDPEAGHLLYLFMGERLTGEVTVRAGCVGSPSATLFLSASMELGIVIRLLEEFGLLDAVNSFNLLGRLSTAE